MLYSRNHWTNFDNSYSGRLWFRFLSSHFSRGSSRNSAVPPNQYMSQKVTPQKVQAPLSTFLITALFSSVTEIRQQSLSLSVQCGAGSAAYRQFVCLFVSAINACKGQWSMQDCSERVYKCLSWCPTSHSCFSTQN